MDEKRPAPTVPAVERAIELLQVLARAGKPLMLSELSELTTASRSTAFNTLATLHRYGFVEKDERYKTYRLGLVSSTGPSVLASAWVSLNWGAPISIRSV